MLIFLYCHSETPSDIINIDFEIEHISQLANELRLHDIKYNGVVEL